MNLRVNLTKRVQTDAGLRYCPVVISGNGRVKPDYVVVNGTEERHPEGAYYVEWRDGSKRHRLSVGKDASTANNRMLRKEAELNAVAKGVTVAPEVDASENAGKQSLAVAISEFLQETKLTKKPKTYSAYTKTMTYFQESCSKLYVEDIDRRDMLKFAAFLKEKKLAPRTCWNKFNNTMSFLKAQGIRGIVKKNDWPSFVEEEPEIYEKEELAALMSVCDPQERLWWDFFLMTGMREQEVMYTTWRDVNLQHSTVPGISSANCTSLGIPVLR